MTWRRRKLMMRLNQMFNYCFELSLQWILSYLQMFRDHWFLCFHYWPPGMKYTHQNWADNCIHIFSVAVYLCLSHRLSWPHSLQMIIQSPSDVDSAWEVLRISHDGLPPVLRPPQRDALYWLSQDKSVVICIGTGSIDFNENEQSRFNLKRDIFVKSVERCVQHDTMPVTHCYFIEFRQEVGKHWWHWQTLCPVTAVSSSSLIWSRLQHTQLA